VIADPTGKNKSSTGGKDLMRAGSMREFLEKTEKKERAFAVGGKNFDSEVKKRG